MGINLRALNKKGNQMIASEHGFGAKYKHVVQTRLCIKTLFRVSFENFAYFPD